MKAMADYWKLLYPILKGASHVKSVHSFLVSEEAMGQGKEWKREKKIFPQNREGCLKKSLIQMTHFLVLHSEKMLSVVNTNIILRRYACENQPGNCG